MRLPNFRALLIALALLVQAAAGGIGVAGIAHASQEHAIAGHCAPTGAPDDGLPSGKSEHGHSCLCCRLGAGSPVDAALIVAFEWRLAARQFALVEFPPSSSSATSSLNARAQQARAPPASHA